MKERRNAGKKHHGIQKEDYAAHTTAEHQESGSYEKECEGRHRWNARG